MKRVLARLVVVVIGGGLCLIGCENKAPSSPASIPAVKPEPLPTAVAMAPRQTQKKESPAVVAYPGPEFKFRDASQEWGFDFVRFDDMQGQNRIQEANGGGIALVDFDLDGRLDVLMLQGSRLPRKLQSTEHSNEFFRNSPAGSLQKITASARLTSHAFHTGCGVGDIDADGFPDIYITAFGKSSLWRNNGDGTFQECAKRQGVLVDTWSSSCLFADFNHDGWLDLFVTTYIVANDDPPVICPQPKSPTGTMQCSPSTFPAIDDIIFINDGQGRFKNVTREAGVTAADSKGLGAVATDVNGDNLLDIYVANDATPCNLYINETARPEAKLNADQELVMPRFADRATEFGVAMNGEGKVTSAMGIAHGDYDRDGWMDLYVTNFYLEMNTLYHNRNGQMFEDLSTASRVGPPTRSTLSFGTEFLDVDHDGWLDLIVPTGHIEDRDWTQVEKYRMLPHLFRNDHNGRFTDVASQGGSYFTTPAVGRTFAVGDLNRDGALDFVVGQQVEPSRLVLNETPRSKSSVIINPVGLSRSPRSGIGVKVRAVGVDPVLIRDVGGGGSFQSASALELHLGLGDSHEFQQLDCTWPDGHVDQWKNVAAGYYVAIEGRGLKRIDFNR